MVKLRSILLFLIAVFVMWQPAMAESLASGIFDARFRTLASTMNGDPLQPLVLRPSMGDRIDISFDLIDTQAAHLRCRLVHCNADWQPSALLESEYLDSFNEATVDDYAFSQNTYIHYINYLFSVTLPDADNPSALAPTRSGNYVLQVFDEDNPDTILLQKRFQVSENSVRIKAEASSRTDHGINTDSQQISMSLIDSGAGIRNPYTDLYITITQNQRPETMRVLTSPMRIDKPFIIYEHLPQLIFKAGNEYRRFETVQAIYPGMHTDSIRFIAPIYNAYLTHDYPRDERPHSYDRTQHGAYKIDELNASDPSIGADYIMCHFTLDFPQVFDADIYVEGELFNRSFTSANRMAYDHSTRLYTLEAPLKQGSYNYQYAILPSSHRNAAQGEMPQYADTAAIDGNKFETINQYNICVYLREPAARADRLVATLDIETCK